VKTASIGELTQAIRTWNPSRDPEREFRYIDLSAVDKSRKVIIGATLTIGAEAPSRARQLVSAGDVLVSTVRPNLNAVAVVPSGLSGSTASTGFTVLRPGPKVDGRYLFHWVRSAEFVGNMVRNATGASYPAVSDRTVKNSLIPIPSLSEQRRIAAILDQADAIRSKRRQIVARLESLPMAMFHDMFGSPEESKENVHFGSLANLSSGRNLVADDLTARSEFRVLKISAVTSGQFKPEESKPLPPGYTPPSRHLVRAGDLLMSRANTTELVGAVAYVTETPPNLALPDKIWRFDWKIAAEPIFYRTLLNTPTVRRRISRLSSGTGGSMKNVSRTKLGAMQLPQVSIGRQRSFVARALRVARQLELVREGLAADDELFASLQARAFRGEL
jgi:type I restriction enzyme S subunit